jgi:hypothetical protein
VAIDSPEISHTNRGELEGRGLRIGRQRSKNWKEGVGESEGRGRKTGRKRSENRKAEVGEGDPQNGKQNPCCLIAPDLQGHATRKHTRKNPGKPGETGGCHGFDPKVACPMKLRFLTTPQ